MRGDERIKLKTKSFDEDNELNDRMIEAGKKEDEKKMCP
jgi:hypothetical protein